MVCPSRHIELYTSYFVCPDSAHDASRAESDVSVDLYGPPGPVGGDWVFSGDEEEEEDTYDECVNRRALLRTASPALQTTMETHFKVPTRDARRSPKLSRSRTQQRVRGGAGPLGRKRRRLSDGHLPPRCANSENRDEQAISVLSDNSIDDDEFDAKNWLPVPRPIKPLCLKPGHCRGLYHKIPGEKYEVFLKRCNKAVAYAWALAGMEVSLEVCTKGQSETFLRAAATFCMFCEHHNHLTGASGKDLGHLRSGPSFSGSVRHLESAHNCHDLADIQALFKRREKGSTQMKLGGHDGVLSLRGASKPFSSQHPVRQRLVNDLAMMLAEENLPLQLGERPGFTRFLQKFEPRWTPVSRRTVTRSVETRAEAVVKKIRKQMSQVWKKTDVSCTTDMWSSHAEDRYCTMSLHWLTNDWHMRCRILGTVGMNERHTAENIS